MTTPTSLPTTITPNSTTGHDTDSAIVNAAVNALTAAAAQPKSASDLTIGTLAAARIADGSIPIAKLAENIATQAELDAVAATVGTANQSATNLTTGTLAAARIADGSLPTTKLAVAVVSQATMDAAIATRQPLDADLTTIAAFAPSSGDMLVGGVGSWTKQTLDQVRALLGTGTATNRPAPLVTLDGALTSRATTPARIVFAGSSTTAGGNASAPAKRWVNLFMRWLQNAYPGGTSEPPTLADINGNFGTITPLSGVQGFNIGESSTTSANYLTDTESQTIASLDPSVIFHMAGGNDWRNGVAIATFEANMRSRIAYIRARTTRRPCTHILVNPYESWSLTGPIAWAEYGLAMARIAADFPADVFYVDLNPRYIAFKIPGAKGTSGTVDTDPNNLISSDKLHQNDAGHEQMARWIYQDVMGVPPTLTATPTTGGGGTGTAGVVTDNFNRTSTTTLGAAQTGQTWSVNGTAWQTDGSVAFLSSGTNGLATIACGYSDVSFSCKVRRPASGTTGIRVRQSEGVNTGLAFYFDSAASLIVLSTVINGTITSKDSLAIPAGVAVGDYATLVLSANGTEAIGYVNGTRTLSATLSASDMTSLPGTSVGLRQTVAGITAGAFDDVSADAVTVALPPSATAITDTFSRAASTTSLGVTDTGQAYTQATTAIWGVSAAGKGYMVSLNGASGGIATLPAAASDVDFTADLVRPSSGFSGIRVRVTGGSSCIAANFDAAGNVLVIATVEASTSTTRASLAVPTTTIAAGAAIKLRLTAVGSVVNLYLNDASTPTLTYTLTGTQITGITGTDVALRQTIAGTGNGSFDNLTVLNLATAADPAVFPTGDITGWKLEWANDFNTTFAKGAAKTTYGSALFGYDGGTDTSRWGTYNSDKTVSGVAGAIAGGGQGYLNIKPYWDATDARYYIVAITPPPPTATTGSNWGQLSGRYSIRMRMINVVKGSYTAADGTTKTDAGFKVAYLNWPAINAGAVDPKGVTVIDPWDYGEFNWPEGQIGSSPEAFAHFATGSAGSRNHGNAMAYQPGNIDATQWHTYTIEWVSGVSLRFFLDGALVAQAPASAIPYVKMYWSLQTETWLTTSIAPPKTGTGDLQVDWAASYTKV